MEDIETMFTDLLGEMENLTQSFAVEAEPPETDLGLPEALSTPVLVSLSDVADNDLDALMADLVADLDQMEEKLTTDRRVHQTAQEQVLCSDPMSLENIKEPVSPLPQLSKLTLPVESEAQAKADKIKLALEKLKEAKIKKLIVKVIMNNGSSKALMVDERQTVRDVLDSLIGKTHCDPNVDWTLYETNPSLQIERVIEDHEFLVECLSVWTRDSENNILFLERQDKYDVFRNPQNFYLWKRDKKFLQAVGEKQKESLLLENFCGPSIIVPDLEGVLYLKEDGKKSWKRRYFLLRASGIYYVPKGKTKTSCDLASFIQFDNLNIYYGMDYKNKYKAPTDFCFVLKHPQIQKESHYIKYLCCDDELSMTLWVTAIRIAKYGVTLYNNYKVASRQTIASSSTWQNRITSDPPALCAGPKVAVKANGPSSQPPSQPKSTTLDFSEASKKGNGIQKEDFGVPPVPATDEILPPPPPDPILPPPPPPPMGQSFMVTSHNQLADTTWLHPPADDLLEPPPDFIPPPPPVHFSSHTPRAQRKVAPPPPKRTTPVGSLSTGGHVM